MAPCVAVGAFGGFDLSGTPGCRSRTHSGPTQGGFGATEIRPPHQDLRECNILEKMNYDENTMDLSFLFLLFNFVFIYFFGKYLEYQLVVVSFWY
jgi:hypothetical protein